MTHAEPVSTEISIAKKTATYYVVPVLPEESSKEQVYYYEEVSKKEKWKKIAAKDLEANAQGCSDGKVRLWQPSVEAICANTDLKLSKLDQTAKLYAAVAKTVGTDDGLPSVYPLGWDGSVTMRVNAGSTRALILVFSKEDGAGMSSKLSVQLTADTEPEIKNSTGAGDD